MKFLIDAQLPSSLKSWLNRTEHDSIHTLDLAEKNRTSDLDIANLADAESRILISKDKDFLSLKILKQRPKQLLLVTTGNIDNATLIRLFEANFETVAALFKSFEIVEFGNSFVVGRNLE